MKNKLLVLVITLANLQLSISQDCPTGNVVLSNQTQVNQFGEDYPNCTSLPANLLIAGVDIVDLSPLGGLQSIGGSLEIYNCNRLKSLDPLSISEINDSLTIEVNDSLVSISVLSEAKGLKYIHIDTNNALENITGFNLLDSLTDFIVFRNRSLINIEGFENLTILSNTLEFKNNISLLSIPSFNNLEKLHRFNCFGNGSLNTMIGFEKLTDLFDAWINLDSLSTLIGFNEVINCGSVRVAAPNPGFININIFNKVVTAGQIGLAGVDQAGNVDAFNELKHASAVGFNTINSVLNGFSKLESLRQLGLSVFQCNFVNLDFISSINDISGFNARISLRKNPFLKDISGLDGIHPDSINFVKISDNPNLAICHSDLICGILERENISPSTDISNNAVGCNSTEEILEQCADKPDEPEEDPTLCPITSRPGMQVDRVDDDNYNIMYHYGIKRMYLRDVKYIELLDLIKYHKVEKELLFDFDTFILERYCERAEGISRGESYDAELPTDPILQYRVDRTMSEIDFFSNFVLIIGDKECVKL